MTVGVAGSVTEYISRFSRCSCPWGFVEKRLSWIMIYVVAHGNLSSFWLFGLGDGRISVWSVSQQAINLSYGPTWFFPPGKHTNPQTCTRICFLIGCRHTLPPVTPGLTPSSHEYSAPRRWVFIHRAAPIGHYIFTDISETTLHCGDHLSLQKHM